ncbi:MAG: calcium/sodium antiporter [Candidatus Hydrogenedentes bacterium]|nr:calcium/sodium antiporter [Candidatus Hydrogenedentota bacterium]
MTWLMLFIGLAILVAGAEGLVRGSSKLAAAAGVSPLVIGLTVVAYGTSTPELAVSVKAAWTGQSDIALGNVVGSNIFTVLFILGACALISPLKVNAQLIRFDVPIMIAVSIALAVMGLNGVLGRIDGVLLFTAIVAYTVYVIRKSRSERKTVQEAFDADYGDTKKETPVRFIVDIGSVAIGLVMLIFGARIFVDSAIEVAQAFGVSELVIGLTIVAIGTSLPEVATSIVATIRGERDIAIGNVVGSNIFNILSVLGISSLVKPISVSPEALAFDIPVMIAVAVACLPIFFTRSTISRWEGVIFLGYYVAYTAYLIMNSRAESVPQIFTNAILYFALPLTGITFIILGLLERRKSQGLGPS